MTWIDLFSMPFMQRALIAAAITGVAAPVVGTYLVQRRLALMGDGIGHVAVTGVALGLLTGTSPTWMAVIVAVLGAVLIEVIRVKGHAGGDVALALLFYGGLSGGVLLTGIGGQSASTLQTYLFGSILTVSTSDLVVVSVLAVAVIVLGIGLSPQLFATAQDPDFAQVAGVNVRFYNVLVAVMAAVSVAAAMRTVGLLLVSALLVVPVAASQQIAGSFRTTLIGAMGFGLVASLGGLVLSGILSFHATVAPGPTIVLLALACFMVTWPIGTVLRRRRRLTAPFPVADDDVTADSHITAGGHDHHHGPQCGHLAVEHGDHVDYVHDGHRHAVHVDGGDQHYDEH